MKTNTINEISIESNENNLYLTFDTDWCSDEILSYTLDLIEKNNIRATFFITHETKLLKRMRSNANIELGIHPNFNPLLHGNFKYGKNIDEVIQFYKNIVPEAVSARSHSLTHSSQILQSLIKYGIKYDCNLFIPFDSNIKVIPYYSLNKNIISVPYSWEDDLHEYNGWKYDDVLNKILLNEINVLDFHPIHVFFNSYSMDNYHKSKEILSKKNDIKDFVNRDIYGSKDFLETIIKKVMK